MVEAAKKRVSATTDRKSLDRNQQQRIAWIGMTAASYAVDTLFLALFAMAVYQAKSAGRNSVAANPS